MITAIAHGRLTTYRNARTFQMAQVYSNPANGKYGYRAGVTGETYTAPTRAEAFRRAMIAIGLGDKL